MSQKALVIYNPSAGSMTNPDLALGAVVHNLCNTGDYEVTVRRTTASVRHTDLVRMLSQNSYDLIAAAGGDGTIRLVLGAVSEAAPQTPVALIPVGTGNQLARNLGIYEDNLLADPVRQAISLVHSGKPTRIDLGKMNDEYFCVAVGAGPLSDAVIVPSQDKANLKMLAYVGSIIKNLATPPVNFRVEAGSDDFQVSASGIFITNVADLGLGTLSDTAEMSDGLLDLCIIAPAEFGDYLGLGFRFAGGITGGEAPYYIRKVTSARLSVVREESQLSGFQSMAHRVRSALSGASDAPPVYHEVQAMVDGDAAGTTPMAIHICPKAVSVLTFH